MAGRYHITRLWIPPSQLSLILLVILILPGCTVARFAAGEKGADLTAIQPGLTVTEAETVLGSPVAQWKSSAGLNCRMYEYDNGRPPNVADAAAMAFLDVISLGLVEVFVALADATGDPRSFKKYMDQQRTTARVLITYDEHNAILGIFEQFDEIPADGRSAPRTWSR